MPVTPEAKPVPPGAMTIGELARRTGVTPEVLRTWEARHGFPRPLRLPSGHRRYAPSDVAAVERVLRRRTEGVRLEVAVAEAFRDREPTPAVPSVFATLRRTHPHLTPTRLRRATLVALSRAIEDECCARAQGPVLFGSFQQPRRYAASAARWTELARTARRTVLVAAEEHLPDDAPMRREWVVGCDGPALCAVLAAWEPPGQTGLADGDRVFEAIWTVDPSAVRLAARVCATVAGDLDLAEELAAQPTGPETDLAAATALFSRVVAYVDAVA